MIRVLMTLMILIITSSQRNMLLIGSHIMNAFNVKVFTLEGKKNVNKIWIEKITNLMSWYVLNVLLLV